MKAKITLENEVAYMRIALAVAGICVNDKTCELIVLSHKGIMDKGGEFSLKDSCKIIAALDEKYKSDEGLQHAKEE